MNKMKKMLCALLAMVMVAGVCVMPTEARSDNAQVKALQEMIDSEEGVDSDGVERIHLQEDITWADGEPIEIPAGKNILFNLNGYTLETLEDFPVFKVEAGAQLKIMSWKAEGAGNGKGEIKQHTPLEGWEQYYEEEWLGLFEVEEGAKLILNNGFFTAGYNMFTSDSEGEIVIDYGSYNMIPNGNYSIPEFKQFELIQYTDDTYWWVLFDYVDMIPFSQSYDIWKNVPVEQEVEVDLFVSNYAEYSLGNVEIQLGYATSDKAFAEGEFIPFEATVVESVENTAVAEGCTVNNGKANIADLAANQQFVIVFVGIIPEELANQEILIVYKLDVIENSVSIQNMTNRFRTTTYQVTSGTQDSITDEEVTKPVDDVTVIKKQETEQAIGSETAKVVGNILSGNASKEVVSEETATKVAEAIESGKTVQAQLVVKEMTTEEVEQITTTDKKAIEDKIATELGEDANLQYLDLSIVLKADDEELGTLNKLEEEITITVAIPEELKAEGRTYKVIRNHNGVVEVLDTIVNDDGTISFKTDRFSTYALAYADNEETNTNPNPSTPSTDNNKDTNTNTNTNQSNNTPSTDSKAPQTGDNNLVMVYVVICLVALAAVVVTKKRNAFVK